MRSILIVASVLAVGFGAVSCKKDPVEPAPAATALAAPVPSQATAPIAKANANAPSAPTGQGARAMVLTNTLQPAPVTFASALSQAPSPATYAAPSKGAGMKPGRPLANGKPSRYEYSGMEAGFSCPSGYFKGPFSSTHNGQYGTCYFVCSSNSQCAAPISAGKGILGDTTRTCMEPYN